MAAVRSFTRPTHPPWQGPWPRPWATPGRPGRTEHFPSILIQEIENYIYFAIHILLGLPGFPSYDHIRVNAPRSISTSKLSILELGLVLAWVTSRETPVSYVLLPRSFFFSSSLSLGMSGGPGLEPRHHHEAATRCNTVQNELAGSASKDLKGQAHRAAPPAARQPW